jgi:hypothetical protein
VSALIASHAICKQDKLQFQLLLLLLLLLQLLKIQ